MTYISKQNGAGSPSFLHLPLSVHRGNQVVRLQRKLFSHHFKMPESALPPANDFPSPVFTCDAEQDRIILSITFKASLLFTLSSSRRFGVQGLFYLFLSARRQSILAGWRQRQKSFLNRIDTVFHTHSLNNDNFISIVWQRGLDISSVLDKRYPACSITFCC